MRFLIRTGTFVLHLVVFFVLVTLLSLATTYFTAERYAGGGTPSRLFPLVALPPGAAEAVPQYQLLRWLQFTRKDPPPPQWNMRLPVPSGEFTEAVIGGFAPHVRFSTTPLADGRQRVEVKVSDDDYVLYAAYATDGKSVQPESLRVWGPSSALLAVFPAFVLTLVMSRLARRYFNRAKTGQPDATAG